MSDSELFPGPTNSIGGYREFLAALVMIVFTLLAILIYLQASDLNPLLLYKPYADWLNSNVFRNPNHPIYGISMDVWQHCRSVPHNYPWWVRS